MQEKLVRTLVIIVCLFFLGCGTWDDEDEYQYSVQTRLEPSPEYLMYSQALDRAKPYFDVRYLPADDDTFSVPIISFDADAAYAAGLEPDEIDFVERIVLTTNIVSIQTQDPDPLMPVFDHDISEFFREHTEIHGIELPGADGGYTTLEQPLCGGSWVFPAACEGWTHHGSEWGSEYEVHSYLQNNGFHKTAWYATRSPYDYTKLVTWPCGHVYRIQGLIEKRDNDKWSFREQHDLNPEIFGWPVAPWPVSWWGAYVIWWHRYYC